MKRSSNVPGRPQPLLPSLCSMFPILLDMLPFLLMLLQILLEGPVPIKTFVPLIISFVHQQIRRTDDMRGSVGDIMSIIPPSFP